VNRDWYDLPHYFDLCFRDENAIEIAFFEQAFKRYAKRRVRRLLEPGCGSGRLVYELAHRGYAMSAFDLSEAAVTYCRRRLARRGLVADVFVADMADFKISEPVDAAFCTFNTFRHLTTEEAAASHLRCVARAVQRGGIYILGLHLFPPDADPECTERYRGESGQTKVTCTLRVTGCDRRRRLEHLRSSLLVRRGDKVLRSRSDFSLRLYNARQLRKLLDSVRGWELIAVHDFGYEIDTTFALNDELADTLLVLRRK
jgi:SAM-dependent methyltransferase